MYNLNIGYFSNLNLFKFSNIDSKVNSIVLKSKSLNLGVLVCAGGISNNYLITKDFVTRLGNALKIENIIFRFIVGNTDFYYDKSESCVDKESKFRQILREYRNNEYYLPTHNINLKSGIRLVGLESWYDYTLYRGTGCDLKDITRKSYMHFFKNKDVVYITNSTDYTQGMSDTFDVRYSNECLELMSSRLHHSIASYGNAYKCVVVQYFIPVKSMLGNNSYDRYMGTFKGSLKYIEPLITNKVTECIIGCKCKNRFVKHRNISLIGVTEDIYVETIDEVNG